MKTLAAHLIKLAFRHWIIVEEASDAGSICTQHFLTSAICDRALEGVPALAGRLGKVQ